MKSTSFLLKLLSVVPAAVVISYFMRTPKYSWVQRLDIIVQTPDGQKSGYGLVEVVLAVPRGDSFLGSQFYWRISGAAAVVDMGDDKYLFGLLYNRDRSEHPDTVFRFAAQRAGVLPRLSKANARAWFKQVIALDRPVEVDFRKHIELAAFTNMSDPSSIVSVSDPEDFERIFGSKYSVLRAEISIVDETPSPDTLYTVLPWLKSETEPFPGRIGLISEIKYFYELIDSRHFVRNPQ